MFRSFNAKRYTELLKHRNTELMNKVNSFDELEVYQAAFALQQDLFGLSKCWPKVEDYSLTDQVRRSSRSIGANIAEWLRPVEEF